MGKSNGRIPKATPAHNFTVLQVVLEREFPDTSGQFRALAAYRATIPWLSLAWRSPCGSQRAFKGSAVPISFFGCCRVRALQKSHQRSLRVGRGAYCIIGQNEFAKLLAEKRLRWPHGRGSKPLRRRVCVRIICRVVDRASARPESCTRHLMGIGLAHHSVG